MSSAADPLLLSKSLAEISREAESRIKVYARINIPLFLLWLPSSSSHLPPLSVEKFNKAASLTMSHNSLTKKVVTRHLRISQVSATASSSPSRSYRNLCTSSVMGQQRRQYPLLLALRLRSFLGEGSVSIPQQQEDHIPVKAVE